MLHRISDKDVMESELQHEEKARLMAAKAVLPPSRYNRDAELKNMLSANDIWHSTLPEDMKYLLARQLEARAHRDRMAERETMPFLACQR